ncbi:4Fe-4S double cluster binding domain-containing protein [Candidatus Latescibacterota bacterium]
MNRGRSSLDDRLAQLADDRGVDFYGIADLTVAHDFILEQGDEAVAAYPRAVSLGICLPDAIVDLLPRRQERAVAIDYRHHAYDVINTRLDVVASEVASLLQREGCSARPVPATGTVDRQKLAAMFSHKLAAHLAGLGWIGKSCLLITPERGPRVRWTTVLTDADLPTGDILVPGCEDCTECADACPVQAFTGRAFDPEEPREVRFDAQACSDYFARMREEGEEPVVCGLCLHACPHGQG